MSVLYIIGNGFDLFHGLRTGYSDYRDYLMEADPTVARAFESFQYIIEPSLDPAETRWSSIEESLELDYEGLLESALASYPLDLTKDNPGWDDPRCFIDVETRFVDDFVKRDLQAWLSGIGLSQAICRVLLERDALFVTFNYTLLLEKRYDVAPDRVLHIHGELAEAESTIGGGGLSRAAGLQFGSPANDPEGVRESLERAYGDEEFYGAYFEPCVRELERYCGLAQKRLSDNYVALDRFLRGRSVDAVCVFGHCYDGVDLPYYRDVLLPKFNGLPWTFVTCGPAGGERAARFCFQMGIDDFAVIDDEGADEVDLRNLGSRKSRTSPCGKNSLRGGVRGALPM